MRLVNESPLARKRSVTASRREAVMVSLNFVSCFEIFPPTIRSNSSKSVGVRRVKFRNPMASSIFNLFNNVVPNLGPSVSTSRVHQRLRFRDLSFVIIAKQALIPHKAMSSMVVCLDETNKIHIVVWTLDETKIVVYRPCLCLKFRPSRDRCATRCATWSTGVD